MYQVDAFANKLFSGNPAAVCILKDWLPDDVMQSIAMENNLSETAFLVKKKKAFYIRWFTPLKEIQLAGHPTLAAAHIIFSETKYSRNTIEFYTNSNEHLSVSKKGNILFMDFPSIPAKKISLSNSKIKNALGKTSQNIFLGNYGMIVLDKEKDVLEVEPNYTEISKLPFEGVIVTAQGKGCDFVSRFFAPKFGILEDPVTGSAHCTLIPYWSKILNKKKMIAIQLSKRGGLINCSFRGSRVVLGGKAITYMSGVLYL